MSRFLVASAFISALGFASVAQAEVISPDAGMQVTLGAMHVTVFYHPTDAGYEVVTTASSNDNDAGGVIRFVSTLAPGQDAIISVPRRAGEAALELHLRRIGDRVEVQRAIS